LGIIFEFHFYRTVTLQLNTDAEFIIDKLFLFI